jgi:hypothetical protein
VEIEKLTLVVGRTLTLVNERVTWVRCSDDRLGRLPVAPGAEVEAPAAVPDWAAPLAEGPAVPAAPLAAVPLRCPEPEVVELALPLGWLGAAVEAPAPDDAAPDELMVPELPPAAAPPLPLKDCEPLDPDAPMVPDEPAPVLDEPVDEPF